MAIDLLERYTRMRQDGEESVVYGKGYVVLHIPDKACIITFSGRTSLNSLGLLKHEEPRSTVEISIFKGKGLGEGTVEELLTAANEGRFETDRTGALIAAIKAGGVLYLKKSQSVVAIIRKDLTEQYIDSQLFYCSTQRGQAISDVAETMRKCRKRLFGKDDIDKDDVVTIVAFIATQLP